MSLELSAVSAAGVTALGGASAQAGYGASFATPHSFQAALKAAEATSSGGVSSPDAIGQALKGMLGSLEKVNGQASTLAEHARMAEAAGNSLTPGEMIMMTVRCHAFLFNCQLTSNIANRTSDGLQQLFRQQG